MRRSRVLPSIGSSPSQSVRRVVPVPELGVPDFAQYQSLPRIITGTLSIPFGDHTFRWIEYLLMSPGRSRSTPARGCSGSAGGKRARPRSSRRCSSTSPVTASSGRATSGTAAACGRCSSASGCSDRVGALVARDLEGRGLRARRVRRRAHVRVPLHHRLSPPVVAGRVRARATREIGKRLVRAAIVGFGGLLTFAFVFIPALADRA